MAQEITISQFERNAKKYNKKGLMRKYSDINTYFSEYVGIKPLAQSSKLVLEVTVDKTVVEQLIKELREKGFDVIGSMNYYFYKIVVDTYGGVAPHGGGAFRTCPLAWNETSAVVVLDYLRCAVIRSHADCGRLQGRSVLLFHARGRFPVKRIVAESC